MMVEMKKGQNDFVGSVFGIFRGFGWVRSSVLINEPGFGRVRSFFFRFVPGFGFVLAEQVRSLGFLKGFEWVRSSVLVDKPGFR